MIRVSRQAVHIFDSQTQKMRSADWSFGRGERRLKIANCCLRARFSRTKLWCRLKTDINVEMKAIETSIMSLTIWGAKREVQCFLQIWNFGEGQVESGGEKYLEIRRKLLSYFDRKNCLSPDELADKTLDRVARRLEEEGSITDTVPAHYCYIVSKFLFHEYLRSAQRSETSIDELPETRYHNFNPDTSEAEISEKLLNCLNHCMQLLTPENREFIVQYYQGEQRAKIENRQALAERAGLTMNALSIRACRLRRKLEACISKCAGW
jgi:DNA-directed RNA polymerase specialized sigma24 family protein